ncbi:hypothetical protein PV10_01661 [Exophiala mesophila]|uniref:Peptidase S54 rhomboid domain-containing protein n=1 Tax=Exophiala mesophila TaxID=212818 RepID=A0A0D1YBI1_EXOME|nr:uncharacterized protein PV10_01661 [Exophiala mesophila]KIV97966.1 hypothetical protein PV10_01661 [Exophiala mesophila]
MVTTSGFSHAPVSRFLIITTIGSSIITSILDIKHQLPIRPTPHLWPYLQLSRILTFQLAYTSSTDLFFSTALLYQFRVLERLWGSRKYASFVAVIFAVNVLLLPFLTVFLKGLTFGLWNYLPAGLTAVVFAALSLWSDEVPRLYRYKILTGKIPLATATEQNDSTTAAGGGGGGGNTRTAAQQQSQTDPPGITLSDKSTTYLLAAQLALCQFPYQLIPALVGWTLGSAWIGELLPGGLSRWRVPAWVVGESPKSKERGQYEGLRRRLEEEGSSADGMRNVSDRVAERQDTARRGFGRQIASYFTGS